MALLDAVMVDDELERRVVASGVLEREVVVDGAASLSLSMRWRETSVTRAPRRRRELIAGTVAKGFRYSSTISAPVGYCSAAGAVQPWLSSRPAATGSTL